MEISEILSRSPTISGVVEVHPKHFGFHRIGDAMSLSKAEAVHLGGQRPVIPLPEVGPLQEGTFHSPDQMPAELVLALLNLRQETLSRDDIENCGKAMQHSSARLKEIQAEKLKVIEEAAARASTHSTWSILKNVATYLVSAASFVLGVGCLASGAGSAAGAFLIASGGLGLVNQVMSDTGGWEKLVSLFVDQAETQQRIARYMECGMTMLAIGMGLFGLGMGYYLGSGALFAQTATKTEQMVKAVKIGGNLMLGTTAFGKAAAEGRVYDSQKKLAEVQERVLENKFSSETYSNHIGDVVKDQQRLQGLAQDCIDQLYHES